MAVDPLKEKALADYKKKLMEHREVIKKEIVLKICELWCIKTLVILRLNVISYSKGGLIYTRVAQLIPV